MLGDFNQVNGIFDINGGPEELEKRRGEQRELEAWAQERIRHSGRRVGSARTSVGGKVSGMSGR